MAKCGRKPTQNPAYKMPSYSTWGCMKQRCLNPRSHAFKHYGGRGIKVCDRWLVFKNFLEDMGHKPPNMSLERTDNDGNYEPGNCRWATQKEQMRNRRINRWVDIGGKSYLAVELSDKSGLKTDSIIERAEAGLSLEEVISPVRRIFADGLALGGRANGVRQKAKTHCPHGHSYDDAIVNKYGWRRCRTCFYAKERERIQRKKKSA